MTEIVILIIPGQQGGKVGTPPVDLVIQQRIPWMNMGGWIDRLALLHESGHVRNDHNAAPGAVVHGIHARHRVTGHEDTGRKDESLLILEEAAHLEHILAAQLLHERRVDLLALLGLDHAHIALVLEINELGIGVACIRSLARQGCGRQRILILPQRLANEVDDLGLAVAATARHNIELLLMVRTLQAGRI